MAPERDKRAEEYRTKAEQAREKAKNMLSDAAREALLHAAQMWEALAASTGRPKKPK